MCSKFGISIYTWDPNFASKYLLSVMLDLKVHIVPSPLRWSKVNFTKLMEFQKTRNRDNKRRETIRSKLFSHHANSDTNAFKNIPSTEPILIRSFSFHFIATNCNLKFHTIHESQSNLLDKKQSKTTYQNSLLINKIYPFPKTHMNMINVASTSINVH